MYLNVLVLEVYNFILFLFSDTVELIECLAPQVNILSGENKYFCEDCFHLNEARMTSQVVTLPSILLLHCSWKKQSR